jgi:hypothetical protein
VEWRMRRGGAEGTIVCVFLPIRTGGHGQPRVRNALPTIIWGQTQSVMLRGRDRGLSDVDFRAK